MGAALAQTVLGIERPRVALLSNGEERDQGHAGWSSRPRPALPSARPARRWSTSSATSRATHVIDGVADVVVTDGFTGNITLKLIEGISQAMLARDPRARPTSLAARASSAGCCCARRCAALRDEIDPEGPGGAYLLGLRKLGVVPHGRFTRYGFSQAILLAARGVARRRRRPHARRARGGGRAASRAGARLASESGTTRARPAP